MNSGIEERIKTGWHALYTKHQHERTIAQILFNKGFEIFLPLYAETHTWKDRTKELSLPLFPCYVFIREGIDRWLQVLTTPGIHSVVSWAGRPAVIPHSEIDAVRRAVENCPRVEPHPFLKTGDWVRVKSGPLVGIEGILVRRKNLFRLVLSVEMVGKSASVEVDVAQVEPMAAYRARPCASAGSASLSVRERKQREAELVYRG